MASTKQSKKSLAAPSLWKRVANVICTTLRWMFITFTRGATTVAVLLLFLSAFSDQIHPQTWIVPPYLGLVFPFVLVGVLIGLVLLLVSKRWLLSLILLTAMLLCSGRIWRYCPIHFFDQESVTERYTPNGELEEVQPDTLVLLTYNTMSLGGVHLEQKRSKIPMIDYINQSGADLVCLQEFAFNANGHTLDDLYKRLGKQYPYHDFMTCLNRKNLGIALFSKYPITLSDKIDKHQKNYIGARYYEVEVKGHRVALVNVHLQSNQIDPKDRKALIEAVSNIETDSINVYKNGLRYLAPAWRKRSIQADYIAKYLSQRSQQQQSLPLIVCGDMNDTPVSYTYQRMRGGLNDAWEEAGTGLGISYRVMPFWFRIDHIFHNDQIRALSIKRDNDVTYSDHYPVIATFQILADH